MIGMQYKRLWRRCKWIVAIGIIAISWMYASYVYAETPTSLGIGLFSILTHEELIMSISLLPSFLCSMLLYETAYADETISNWMSLLAYPVHPIKWIWKKMFVLWSLQSVLLLPALGIQYFYYHTISQKFLILLCLFHLLQYLFFMVYCYGSSRGYVIIGEMVSVVNVWKQCSNIFLLICILNLGDWLEVFINLRYLILIGSIGSFIFLLRCSKKLVHCKVERELVLKRILHGNMMTQNEVMMKQCMDVFDVVLQGLCKLGIKYLHLNWNVIASIEVCLKEHSIVLLSSMLCIGFAIIYRHSILDLLAFFFILRLYRYFKITKDKINLVFRK